MQRRMLAVVAAVAVPLGLIAPPVHAAPVVTSGEPPVVEWMEGTVERLKTRTNKVVLTDGRVLRYDKNDLILAQHLFDVQDPEGFITCDLFDSGGEETVARFASSGLEVSLDYLEFPRMKAVSSFMFSINTCDGVVDAADRTP